MSALLLAAIGIYGLMAYSVQQRTQEIGIRMALGAASDAVRNMVIRQGMGVALAGVAIGLAAALRADQRDRRVPVRRHAAGSGRVHRSCRCCSRIVALVGVWLPARRAARVDPVIALRDE